MIVVDTMVVAYGLLPHPQFAAEVERVREKDAAWGAPLLWRSELRSTLMKYVRSANPDLPGDELGLSDAVALMRDAENLLANRTFDVDSEKVMRLSDQSGCSAYDCEYVALARDLDVPLVTYDQAVLRAFPETAVYPGDVAGDI